MSMFSEWFWDNRGKELDDDEGIPLEIWIVAMEEFLAVKCGLGVGMQSNLFERLRKGEKYQSIRYNQLKDEVERQVDFLQRRDRTLTKELQNHKHPYLAHVHPCECTQQSVDAYTKKIQEYKKQALKPGE